MTRPRTRVFPPGCEPSRFRPLSWSDDGRTLFFGIAKWEEKPAPPAKGETAPPKTSPEEPSTVEVWHWKDVLVMPYQKNNAAQLREAAHGGGLASLTRARSSSSGRTRRTNRCRRSSAPRSAYVAEWSRYAMNRTIGRPSADLYLQDIKTGARTKILDGIDDDFVQAGPSGEYLLFSCGTTTIGRSTWRRAPSSTSPRTSRPHSSTWSPIRPLLISRPSASPVGQRTMRLSCSTISMTFGRSRRTEQGAGG